MLFFIGILQFYRCLAGIRVVGAVVVVVVDGVGVGIRNCRLVEFEAGVDGRWNRDVSYRFTLVR